MNPAGQVTHAVEHLQHAGVIAFPTETVFGLGADAHNTAAIQKLYALKGRHASKVMALHVCDATMAKRYTHTWPEIVERWTTKLWPGPLTIVLEAAPSTGLSHHAIAPDATVGLRCPNHEITRAVIKHLDRAIIGTSANASGQTPCLTPEEVRTHFANHREVLVIDADGASSGVASTVVRVTHAAPPQILRVGAITAADLGID